MLDFAGSPIWGPLAAIATVVTVILGGATYWLSRKIKRLVYHAAVNKIELSGIQPGINHPIRITVNGKAVWQLYNIQIEIRNAGNLPIPSSDYEAPLQIKLGALTKIVSSSISETRPHDLARHVEYKIDDSSIVFNTFLLNPGDLFTFQALVLGLPKLEMLARIIGLTGLEEVKPQNHFKGSSKWFDPLFVGSGIVAIFALTTRSTFRDVLTDTAALTLASVGIISFGFYVVLFLLFISGIQRNPRQLKLVLPRRYRR